MSRWFKKYDAQNPVSRKRLSDLKPMPLGNLPWTEPNIETSLDDVYKHVVTKGKDAVDWYLQARKSMKVTAIWLRALAIFCTALAGILPILQGILLNANVDAVQFGPISIPTAVLRAPAWASVLVATAAALVLLDRFFGYSQAWMRYMDTQLRITRILDEFCLDWQIRRAAMTSTPIEHKDLVRLLLRARQCESSIGALIQTETRGWIDEFRDVIKQIDESAVNSGIQRTGTIHVIVTNGDRCAAGWKLTVDGGQETIQTGKMATVSTLAEGMHHLIVTGIIDGKAMHAQATESISVGLSATVELTLE